MTEVDNGCGDDFDAGDDGEVTVNGGVWERLYNAELLRAIELGFVANG